MIVSGTGKSTVLKHVKLLLEEKRRANQWFDFVVGSFTALAAYQLRGTTLHSAFRIPVFQTDQRLEKALQRVPPEDQLQRLRAIKFILIDEIGMLGKRLALFIDHRMRQADVRNSHLPFGGRSVLLAGDYSQLTPVGKN